MSNPASTIRAHLQAVAQERACRLAVAGLADRVLALKAYQQRRFALTYADLLGTARYGPASRFFLGELYGPSDFTQRDAQFERVVPALVRLFPREVVDTVAALAELHALSETLDTTMAMQLPNADIDRMSYVRAWCAMGHREERLAQISMTVDVATRLDRLTQGALMRHSLRLMRAPARAAGLSELQGFLEAGFETFRAMNGAREFVETIAWREAKLASALFDAKPGKVLTEPSLAAALAALP